MEYHCLVPSRNFQAFFENPTNIVIEPLIILENSGIDILIYLYYLI